MNIHSGDDVQGTRNALSFGWKRDAVIPVLPLQVLFKRLGQCSSYVLLLCSWDLSPIVSINYRALFFVQKFCAKYLNHRILFRATLLPAAKRFLPIKWDEDQIVLCMPYFPCMCNFLVFKYLIGERTHITSF